MKKIVNTKTAVPFQLLSWLFVLTIVLHVVTSVASSHPLLHASLALVEAIGWIGIGLIWTLGLLKGVQQWMPKLRTRMSHWRHLRGCTGNGKQGETVSEKELRQLSQDVGRLRLALYGLTPEMEHAHRMQFQKRGLAAPGPVLPAQNVVLYAEFASFINVLSHLGFSSGKSAMLQQKDLAFLQQWGRSLETRVRQQRRRSFEQQATLRAALATIAQQQKRFGETCPAAHHHGGYQRIEGALRLLENLVNDQNCPWDLVQTYVQKLQSDLNTLQKQGERLMA